VKARPKRSTPRPTIPFVPRRQDFFGTTRRRLGPDLRIAPGGYLNAQEAAGAGESPTHSHAASRTDVAFREVAPRGSISDHQNDRSSLVPDSPPRRSSRGTALELQLALLRTNSLDLNWPLPGQEAGFA